MAAHRAVVRISAVLALASTVGCATAPQTEMLPPVATPRDVPPAVARFAEYPDTLESGLAAACAAPNERFLRRSRQSFECRGLMPPRLTAGTILFYDGSIEDLPELVMRVDTRKTGGGYEAELRVFLDVPRKSGPTRYVGIRDARVDDRIGDVLTAAGGTLLP